MAVDSTIWDESNPVSGDFVAEGPDNFRAAATRVRTRMAKEHAWPSSQTSSNQAGYHTFITLSGQTASPSLVYGAITTQLAAIWCSSGSKAVIVTDSAGTNYTLVSSGKGVNVINAVYSTTGTLGELVIGTSGGQLAILSPGSSGQVLTASTGGTGVVWSSVGGLLGAFAARSFATTYQATSDGFVIGNTTATSASHEYTAYQDSNATPSTVVQKGSIVWVAGGQAVCIPVSFPVKKNNYYSVVASGASGTLQFIPFGA